jgi:L-alanine-DL-glutamate epimerase-like enolase superfamily enzyme
MRIVRLEVTRLELRLAEPYTIAYETIDRTVNVLVRIVTDGRVTGVGVAAPDREVTGETADGVETALARAEGVLRGRDPLRRAALLERLRDELPGQPSALAALDAALHDLLGRVAGLPLCVLLGGQRESIVTSVTLGIAPEEETVARARDWIARGARCLKLKGGKDAREDASRVLAVRAAVGPDVELRFDANQGYGVEEARQFVEAARGANLELLEQPTPREALDELGRVTRTVALPVMADESVMGLRDAFRLARDELADMLNVKLMKVGGTHEALHVLSVARVAGFEVMVGCMDECALSIAAGLHFALARSQVAYADLDGHLDLLDDPTAGAVILDEGVLRPTGEPGLGLDPAE